MTSSRRFLTVENTAGGTREMAVAGTPGAPVRFRVGPPAGEVWGLGQIILAISDNATFNQTDFGGIAGPLPNGLQAMFKSTAGGDVDVFSGFTVKSNMDWLSLPAECTLTTWAGTAQTLAVNLNNFGATGQLLLLDGTKGEELVVLIRDNLTTLVAMRAVCRYIRIVP
jgi:hypothetical protein